jgi:hypothetical protein
MALTVLLIDSDVDALSELATALRGRGLTVALADSLAVAVDQAQKLPPSAVLVAPPIAKASSISGLFDAEPALRGLPWFELVDDSTVPLQPRQLPRSAPDVIARRLWSLESAPPPVSSVGGDFRGDLKQVGVTDLLQLLSMNQRTGSLTITTAIGVGEVRLARGEIVDAIYRKVEGSKALFRLIGETEGSFAFMSGTTTAQRRVEESTQALLLEGFRQVDEARSCRQAIGSDQDALQSVVPTGPGNSLPDRVLVALEVPHTIDELLDLLPDNDLAILQTTHLMLNDRRVRCIERGAVRVELADAEQMNSLSNVVRQLRRPGFSGNPRIIVFASQNSLGAALHSLGRIADAWRTSDLIPVAPAAHTLATLRLNDGAELDVVGLPNAAGCSPLWGMTLPGSAAVIALGEQFCGAIEEACSIFGAPFVRAEALLGSVEVGDPKQMAMLVRAALEAAAGR